MLYRFVNFWLMDITASLLVFISAWYGKIMRRKMKSSENSRDAVLAAKEKDLDDEVVESQFCATVARLFFYTVYFALMAASVVLFQSHPYIMISVQHITVIFCIMLTFFQWFKPYIALCFGGLFSLTWIMSAATTFRWVINDIVIGLFALLVSHVHFQNFPSLQMFLWIAVVYDVCLVKTIPQGLPSLFSTGGFCDTVLCKAFEVSDAWELPTIFTFKLGPREGHVYLGAGDIIIGCMVANFSQMFFRSSKYLSGTVLSYTGAIALLSQVENEPYPALVTIVPLCSFQLVVSAILSRKARRLFSFQGLDNGGQQGGLAREIQLLI